MGLHKPKTLPSAFDVGQPKLQVVTDGERSRMLEWLSMNENQKAAQWPVSYSKRGHRPGRWPKPPCRKIWRKPGQS